VLERNDWLGGAIHAAELTQPGYLHDVFSAWHPLWVGGAAPLLGDGLAARGLEYLNTGCADEDRVSTAQRRSVA
jgi:phytoene dehydrogenase-like protein